MKNNLVKYIVVGIICCALFMVGWALLDMWIRGDAFVDGFKGVLDWVLGVAFGTSCAWTVYKNDQKKAKDEDKKE